MSLRSLLLFTLVVTVSHAQSTTAETLLSRWSLIQRQFIALAEAMPASAFAFRPSGGAFKDARTFGEQVKHVACANVGFFNEIEGKAPPQHCETGGPDPATSKPELLTYLRASFAQGDAVILKTGSGNLLAAVEGPYGGPSNRLGIITLAIWHASDHFGQLVVYQRMNGIVPPSSRP